LSRVAASGAWTDIVTSLHAKPREASAEEGGNGYPPAQLKHLFREIAVFLMEKYVESLISLEYDLHAIDWGRCALIFT
jgi:hypothetical protein